MPREFEDSGDPLQQDSQPAAPPPPAGLAAAAPLPAPEPPTSRDVAPRAATPPEPDPRTPWLRPADGPVIATDTLPLRPCPACNTPLPVDAATCPRCGRFAPKHKDLTKRLRKHDVDKLIAKVKADYGPESAIEHHICENLGLTLAELKATRPGGMDHQRLLDAVKTITAILESSRSSRPQPREDLSYLSDDQLADRLEAHARYLRRAKEFEDYRDGAEVFTTGADRALPSAPVAEPIVNATPLTAAPAPEPTCIYCHQSSKRCAEIKSTRLDDWRALHYADPAEIKRRDEDAADQYEAHAQGWPTARMLERAASREVPETDEEKRQREVRQRLGWEAPGATIDANTGRRR